MMIFKYFCSVCRADGRAVYGSNHFEYALPDGRIADAPTEIGWCHDCQGLRPLETLERDYWVCQIRTVGEQLTSITIRHRPLRKSLVTFQDHFGDERYERSLDPDAQEHWQHELDQALAGFDLLALRQSPAHCISCGGTNFERSCYRHPGCGGEFEGEYAGHIMMRGGSRAIRLSVEGDEL